MLAAGAERLGTPTVALLVELLPPGVTAGTALRAALEHLGATTLLLDPARDDLEEAGDPLLAQHLGHLERRALSLPATGNPGRAGELLQALLDEARTALLTHLRPNADGPTGPRSGVVVLTGARLADSLGFWRAALEGSFPVVVVVTGSSLRRSELTRSGEPGQLARSLGRHEARLRRLLGSLGGARAFFAFDAFDTFDPTARSDGSEPRLADRPAALAKGLADFLGLPGQLDETSLSVGDRDDAGGDPTDGSGAPPAELSALETLLRGLDGDHDHFVLPPLPPESLLSVAVEGLSAEADQLLGGLEWAARQLEPLLNGTPPRDEPKPRRRAAKIARKDATKDRERPDEEDDEEEAEEEVEQEGGYHLLNASEDRASYHRWLKARRQPVWVGASNEVARLERATKAPPKRDRPLVSVVVPVWRTPLWALERCVGSVLAQELPDWQLCLCDDASKSRELTAKLRALSRLDRRISVTSLATSGGISAATNAALGLARGEFVAFLDHDDELAPEALRRVAEIVEADQEVDVLYSDEDKIDATGERFDPLFKPDWSPDMLLSFAYLAHLMVVRRRIVEDLGGLRSAFDGSQDWDLALRATERARRIVHIPEVLYHWRTLPTSASSGSAAKPWAYEAGRRVLEDALVRQGGSGKVTQHPRFPGRYHVRRDLPSQPLVSAVIPFRDEPALLATCATSLRATAGYDNFELVLVDNGSELPETAELLDRLAGQPGVRVIDAPGPFNWAAINNAAARQAAGEVLLFANNDIEARVPGWLDALVGHALRPEVGAVGARLLYPDGTIQHAGVILGLGGIAGHVLRGLPGDRPGYNSMAIQTRNCSVVTGACMMVRRDVFEAVGGFDEELPVAFNDVDFCLKVREKGYLIVYEPLAELVHHESRSRGHTDDLLEGRRIVERWGPTIAAGDPYHNANLSHWRDWCPLSSPQEEYRWKIYLEKSLSTPRSSSRT